MEPARQSSSQHASYHTCDQSKHKVETEQVRTFGRRTIPRQKRRVDDHYKSTGSPSNKTAYQQRNWLAKQNLPHTGQSNQQARPDQNKSATQTTYADTCREDGYTRTYNYHKEHKTNKICTIAQRGQVQSIEY